MLNLYDYLTKEDNKKIDAYIRKYGTHEYIGNEEYLKYWRDSKKKLFHLLGGKLIYKVPFQYNKNNEILQIEMSNLVWNDNFPPLFKNRIYHIMQDIDPNHKDNYWIVRDFVDCLVSKGPLSENTVSRGIKYTDSLHNKMLQIQQGGKIMKAIQKTIKYFAPDDTELLEAFEKFRIKHSLILNEKEIKGTLCLSIHPLDFLTMSDNASNWSSCMNWTKDHGCYHVGTVEMMNSNNVICAYVESNKPYIFDEENNYAWNNKKWRQLFYCTKEIIVSGKPYPYNNLDFTRKILEILRELAKENWNRTYSFGIEEYNDMKHIFSYYRMEKNREWINYNRTTKHNIIFDTNGMYNDMLNDSHTTYLCIRNKVKKNTIINYSGKAPCAKCMNPVIEFNDFLYIHDEESYNERYENVNKTICGKCYEEYHCIECGTYSGKLYKLEGTDKTYCKECWKNYIKVCPDCGKPFYQYIYHPDIIFYEIKEHSKEDDTIKSTFYEYRCCNECHDKLIENKEKVSYKDKIQVNRYYTEHGYVFNKIFSPDDDFVTEYVKLKTADIPA